jgi:hypothetical protein
MGEAQAAIPFAEILGASPAEWFLACQRHRELFVTEDTTGIDRFVLPGLLERSKGSVFHFRRCFPDDARLGRWAELLEGLSPP